MASSLQEESTAEESKRFHDDRSPASPATIRKGSKIKSYQASMRKEAAMGSSERYVDSENEEPNANDYPSKHDSTADVTAGNISQPGSQSLSIHKRDISVISTASIPGKRVFLMSSGDRY